MRRDLPIAIGAVGFRDNAITFGDAYEVVLKQSAASADANILIHGIGGQMQLAGRDPALAMLEFVEYAGSSPLVAFRAEFDQSMLVRAARTYLGVALSSHSSISRSCCPRCSGAPNAAVSTTGSRISAARLPPGTTRSPMRTRQRS